MLILKAFEKSGYTDSLTIAELTNAVNATPEGWHNRFCLSIKAEFVKCRVCDGEKVWYRWSWTQIK